MSIPRNIYLCQNNNNYLEFRVKNKFLFPRMYINDVRISGLFPLKHKCYHVPYHIQYIIYMSYDKWIHLQIQCHPYKNSNSSFHRNGKKIIQFKWNHNRPQIDYTISRKKARDIILPKFKLYYKDIIIKTVYQHKN